MEIVQEDIAPQLLYSPIKHSNHILLAAVIEEYN